MFCFLFRSVRGCAGKHLLASDLLFSLYKSTGMQKELKGMTKAGQKQVIRKSEADQKGLRMI